MTAPLVLGRRRLAQRAPQVAERDLRRPAPPRARGRLAQDAHGLRIARGIALVAMDRDPLGVRAGRGEQLRRARMTARPVPGGELRVHRLAHERMHEREPPPAAEAAPGTAAPGTAALGEVAVGGRTVATSPREVRIAASSRASAARLAVSASRSASAAARAGSAPSPRITTARASAVAAAGRRRSRASAERLTVREVWRSTRAALAAVGASVASSRRSSPSRNGLPPVTRAQAAVNASSGSPSAPVIARATAPALSPRGSRTSIDGLWARLSSTGWPSPASAGRAAATRLTASPSSRCARYASQRSDAGSAQWTSSTSTSSGRSTARFATSQ